METVDAKNATKLQSNRDYLRIYYSDFLATTLIVLVLAIIRIVLVLLQPSPWLLLHASLHGILNGCTVAYISVYRY